MDFGDDLDYDPYQDYDHQIITRDFITFARILLKMNVMLCYSMYTKVRLELFAQAAYLNNEFFKLFKIIIFYSVMIESYRDVPKSADTF